MSDTGDDTTPAPLISALKRSWRTPALGYAVLLAASLVVTVVLLVAAAISSDSVTDDLTGDDDVSGVRALLAMPFQLAAMALLGTLRAGDGVLGVSLFAPPLLLTALFCGVVFVLARRDEAAHPLPSHAVRGQVAGLLGLGLAPIVWLVTRLLTFAGGDDGSLHAASVSLVFGVALLTAASAWAGRSRHALTGSPLPLRVEYVEAGYLWLQHVATWLVVFVPVAFVLVALDSGVAAAVVVAVWGVTAGLDTYALGHLSAMSAGGEFAFAWSNGAAGALILVGAAVVLGLATSVAWHLRRSSLAAPALTEPGSWVPVPVAFGVGGLIVWLAPVVIASGDLGGLSAGAAILPGPWTFLMLALWGLAIEAASRFVAPALVAALPAPVTSRLGRGLPPGVVGPVGQTPAPVSAPAPMTAQQRARLRRGLVIGGGVLVAVVALLAVVGWINSARFGPERTAEAYLDAVVDGDVSTVVDLAPLEPDDDRAQLFASDASDALLDPDIYAATAARVTGYSLGETERDGGQTTAPVELEGLDEGGDAELTLVRSGKKWLLFDEWEVADGGLAGTTYLDAADGADAVSVNGVQVEVSSDDEDDGFWALPGTYVVDPYADNRWIAPAPEEQVVAPGDFLMSMGSFAELAPSDELEAAVAEQVDAQMADCMAVAELEPDDCPQSVYAYGDVRDVTWTLDSAPVAELDYFDGTFPARFSAQGEATATYEIDESYTGHPEWQGAEETTTFYLSGTIELVDDEVQVELEFY